MNKYFFICLACFLGLSCAKNGDDELARSWTGSSFFAHTTDWVTRTVLYDDVKVRWAGQKMSGILQEMFLN